jgi:fatty-acyl-CoA synthase
VKERTDRETFESLLDHEIQSAGQASMWHVLEHAAGSWPDRLAVISADRWTFAELFERVEHCAAALETLGVGFGTRVATLFHPCTEWAVLHYALARVGAICVPVSLAFEEYELKHLLQSSQAELLISLAEYRGVNYQGRFAGVSDLIRDGVMVSRAFPYLKRAIFLPIESGGRIAPGHGNTKMLWADAGQARSRTPTGEDPAYIVYTSGSTSYPKPALCPHRAFIGAGLGYAAALGMGACDRNLALLPTYHSGGISCVLMASHTSGGAVVFSGAFEPAGALRAIEDNECTVALGFDTIFNKMRAHPDFDRSRLRSLRKANIAGTPTYLGRAQLDWEFETLTSAYGSTETGGLVSVARPWMTEERERYETNGAPLPGVEVKVVDPDTGHESAPGQAGEICLRGWPMFLEYSGMPEETASAVDELGYFHSGDYGALDPNGLLTYMGRYKMMIKSGGENVSEREVEAFLEESLDSVRFAQVVGIPSELWGEAVVAFVDLVPGTDAGQLRAQLKGRIASFKIPKQFHVMEASDFPTLPNGRPDKSALRALASELGGELI